MLSIDVNDFRNDIFGTLERVIEINEPIKITAKEGNVVLISEMEYNGIVETLNSDMIKKLMEGKNMPIE